MRVLTTIAVALVVLLAACAPSAPATTAPSPTPVALTMQLELPTDPVVRRRAPILPHVFVVVMENTSLARALRSPAIGGLAATYGVATNYHGVARPSLPNYLAMTSGSTWGVTDNGYHPLPATGLGTQLTEAGIPWRAYLEGLTDAGCMRSPYPYALKHNPFAYYAGGCPANVVPLDALESDLRGDMPNFAFIKPGLCNDGHDCSLDIAGRWLAGMVARIVSSDAWRERGVLFVVWDEGDGGDAGNLAPLLVVANGVAGRETHTRYDHYSLLATIEDLFGLPRLGAAQDATPLRDLLPD